MWFETWLISEKDSENKQEQSLHRAARGMPGYLLVTSIEHFPEERCWCQKLNIFFSDLQMKTSGKCSQQMVITAELQMRLE